MEFLKNIPKLLYFPLLLLGVTLLLTISKAHGSSIGMYDQYFYGRNVSGIMIGSPRPIRSDEYLVNTTRIISQYQVNYSDENSLYGTGVNFSLVGAPVRNWTILFRPQNWEYLLLPIEYAFSWMWWSRAAFLIFSFYLIMLWITKQKILPSALLALAFFFSPFIQWWYSGNLIEILTFGILILIVFIRLVSVPNLKQLILYSLTFTYLSICFAVLIYPPFQIPVVYCMMFLAGGYLMQNPNLLTKVKLKRVIPALTLSLLVILGVLGLWYFSFEDIINLSLHTVYPGQRRVTGGNMLPLYLLGGFFDIQFLSDGNGIPRALGSNQSEAASFLMLSLFILPIILFGELKALLNKRRKLDWIAVAACAYFTLLLVWGFWGLPQFLARITLLRIVPAQRIMIGFGLINILSIPYYLFRYRRVFNKEDLYIFAALYAVIIFIGYITIGRELRNSTPQFIQRGIYIIAIALIAGMLLYLLLVRYQKTFVWLFLFVSIGYTFSVNPISFGLDSILKSEFSLVIQEVKKSGPPDAKWIAFESLVLGDYLVANGVPALNASYAYPDLKLWSEFDPSHEFIDIYNRQSHVIFSESDSNQAKFELLQGGLFRVEINPCSPTLKQVGVNFYVFIKPVFYSCLQKVATVDFPKYPLYVYERK